MHGIIHVALHRFVAQSYGEDAWLALMKRAGLEGEIFTPLNAYPDELAMKLVTAAVEMTGAAPADVLSGFGEFIVPTYLALYGHLLKPEWRTLEVIEHTEETIHRVVRMRQPGAEPPRLRTRRTSSSEVVLTYDSPRKLCAVARGIARGLAKHFHERLAIHESRCMLQGALACVIAFQITPFGSGASIPPK